MRRRIAGLPAHARGHEHARPPGGPPGNTPPTAGAASSAGRGAGPDQCAQVPSPSKGKLETGSPNGSRTSSSSNEKLVRVRGARWRFKRAIARPNFPGLRAARRNHSGRCPAPPTNVELYAEMDRFQTDPDCRLIV